MNNDTDAITQEPWIQEFINVYISPNDATHVAEFLQPKCGTTSLAAQDGLVEKVACAIYDADEDAITANIDSSPNLSDEAKREWHDSIGPKIAWQDIHPETRSAYLTRAQAALASIEVKS